MVRVSNEMYIQATSCNVFIAKKLSVCLRGVCLTKTGGFKTFSWAKWKNNSGTFGKVNSILIGESLEGFHAVSAFSVASRTVGAVVIQMEITTLHFNVGEVTDC